MKAFTHSPGDIFGNQIRYVVPLFQRPYVWNENDQWRPLWDDVSALAERILDASPAGYGAPPVAPHFLGAIVIEQQLAPVAYIGVRHVIDGQQRLTTLQLLLDAAQWVVERYGNAMDSQALRVLVENNPQMAQDPDHVFKVWPTDRDQAAFRAAMDNESVVPPSLSGSRIAQAHAFFVEQIEEWAEVSGDPDKASLRLAALGQALREHLRVVVIDLEHGDNAQVIFETLNHRGTPLLASDLVKNLVFQVASAQGLDVEHLYKTYWRDLDSDYWRQLVAQGRLYRPRIDVFLNRWLTMKLLREVPSDRVFSDFRDSIVLAQESDISVLLAELAADAEVHRSMEMLPVWSDEGRFYYRVLKALDTQVVGTFLMWILRYSEEDLPAEQRAKALRALESWLVRRALCRATTKDHNKMVLDLLRELVEAGPSVAGDTTERVLAQQSSQTRYWPNDDALRANLTGEPVYKNLSRPRLRMILEALEDAARGPLGEGQPCPQNLTIEHVMPQSWKEHWGADIAEDEIAGLRRDQLVQTLGNLTLVNAKLNPTLSNRPWTPAEAQERGLGAEGKRDYLLGHSELKLNAMLVASHPTTWTEADIRARTDSLTTTICEIWPCPPDAAQPQAEVLGDLERAVEMDAEPEAAAGKYAPLKDWLMAQPVSEVRLTFTQLEEILDAALPESARHYSRHWRSYTGSALVRAIRDAGWRTRSTDLEAERVVLEQVNGDSTEGFELVPWGDSEDDPLAAAAVWNKLSPVARNLFRTLIDLAPTRISADELAAAQGMSSGPLGIAGALTWPARHAAALGREAPWRWEDGPTGGYWMDEPIAELFGSIARADVPDLTTRSWTHDAGTSE